MSNVKPKDTKLHTAVTSIDWLLIFASEALKGRGCYQSYT